MSDPDAPPLDPEALIGALLARMDVATWRTSAGDIDVLLGIPRDERWNLARYEHLREDAVLVEFGDQTGLSRCALS